MVNDRLVLLPSLTTAHGPRGGYILTKKFVDGMSLYVRHWPGPVTVVIEKGEATDGNLDEAEWRADQLPFEVIEASFFDRPFMMSLFAEARLVAAGLDHRQTHLSAWARRAGTKIVYTSEYTLRTRQQIVSAQTPQPWLRARRQMWAAGQELRYRRALGWADGLQCNGHPTYESYRRLVRETMLFYDTRARRSIDPEELERKVAFVREDRPLRLAFSGRLNRMKGVDSLIHVAASLARRRVPFTFDIWGDGPLMGSLRASIEGLGLGAQVRLGGVIDYETELVSTLERNIDLYVICHRQGDPSCTYLETLACGIPIVGFANEAWAGLVRQADFGWSAPIDDVAGVVDHLVRLHDRRDDLGRAMKAARAFASEHTFEPTFARRLAHLRRVAGLDDGVSGRS